MSVTYLVYGLCAHGKTTLGKNVLHQGLVEASIEMDDFDKWFGKEKILEDQGDEVSWSDPQMEEMHRRAWELAPRVRSVLEGDVIMTGVWLGNDVGLRDTTEFVTCVIKPTSRETARDRWNERGGTPLRFDTIFPPEAYRENISRVYGVYLRSLAEGSDLPLDHQIRDLEWDQIPLLGREPVLLTGADSTSIPFWNALKEQGIAFETEHSLFGGKDPAFSEWLSENFGKYQVVGTCRPQDEYPELGVVDFSHEVFDAWRGEKVEQEAEDEQTATESSAQVTSTQDILVVTEDELVDGLVRSLEQLPDMVPFTVNEPDTLGVMSVYGHTNLGNINVDRVILLLAGNRPLPPNVAENVVAQFEPDDAGSGLNDMIDYLWTMIQAGNDVQDE